MFSIKKFFIFLFVTVKGRKLHKRHIIAYKGKPYTHIKSGLYIRRLFSLTFQKTHMVKFLNKKNNVVTIHALREEHINKYRDLPKFSVSKKRIWKG